jgi:hypothetical protein
MVLCVKVDVYFCFSIGRETRKALDQRQEIKYYFEFFSSLFVKETEEQQSWLFLLQILNIWKAMGMSLKLSI